jgi:hypothetical protein
MLYALPAMIGRYWSGRCVIARARHSPWNGTSKSPRIRTSIACPSLCAMADNRSGSSGWSYLTISRI